MFNIDEKLIKDGCLMMRTYIRGDEYHRQRRVKSLNFNPRSMVIEGVVEGGRRYNVYAAFNKDGGLNETGCDCPAANKYWGSCKHIVAMLLTIMEQDEKGRFNVEYRGRDGYDRQVAKELFSLFERVGQVENKKLVNLEVTYSVNLYDREYENRAGYLSFKIGEDRLYVVRSIPNLLTAWNAGKPLEYGKNFTFDPFIHSFSPEDHRLMEFLTEVYEVQGAIEEANYYNASGIFSGKQMALTHALARRFFQIMGDRPFRMIMDNKVFEEMEIIDGDLPIPFNLGRDENDLLLEAAPGAEPIPLTKGGEYVLMEDKIYKLSHEKRLAFMPLYNTFTDAFSTVKGRKIRFTKEDRERFVSEVLPFVENVGKVSIKPEVKSIILKEDLHGELYLRPQDEGIGCDVKFIYGNHEINPFGGKREGDTQGEQILIRDSKGEQGILDILDEYGFSVQPGGAYLEDEEAIFDFLYSGVPRMQTLAHIYYSEDFKGYMTRRSFSYTGGIRLNTQMDMLEFNFEVDGIDPDELGDIFSALREKKRYYRLRDGTFINLEGQELDGMVSLMEDLDIRHKDFAGNVIQLPKYRALFLDEQLKETGIKGIRRNKAFNELVSNIKEPGDLDLSPPSDLKDVLRGYQDFGFRWLKTLSAYGMGGILADDMGLGKTLQVITLLQSDKEEKGQKPSLAVVPTSLVYNWEDEVKKFAPSLNTLVLTGTKDERMEKLKEIEKVDLVITSYPLIRRDGEELGEFSFRYCILDEAQHIKNPDSQNAKTVKTMNAEVRLALTGTPMENTLTELWSIFDFVMPGYLFSHGRFKRQFESPIVKDGDEKAAHRLSYHIKPFILRRVKRDVLKELPDKIEHQVTAELTRDQKKVYLAYMQKIKADIEKEIEDKGFNNSHIKILAGLTRLRQICCHPSTFLENYNGGSGKMELLGDIIEEALQGEHRILLFSQFTSMLEIIKEFLEEKDVEYLYLDGSTPVEERGHLVRAFNAGKGEVFLISLKAGGTGLNLTGADTVIHFDPWWNPAVEDQATDRAHRIGQEKVVHVMKFITRGTIEEKIFDLQQKKKELIDTVIQPGHTLLTKMTEEEIRELFAI